jgi:biopolymer transport protein ExbD
MHIRRSKRAMPSVIPTATMADIAFLLIIFFMVTTAYSLDRTPMDLPQTEEQEQIPKGAAIISITRDGQLRFSAGEGDVHRVPGLPALAAEIRSVTATNSLHPFVIKADRNVPYRVIDQVLEELRGARAQDITLLSQSERVP